MRFPQVSEKVKEAPANALRSVFASIGQVMLITDRMKKKPGESEKPAATTAEPATGSATSNAAGGANGTAEAAGVSESAAAATEAPAGTAAEAPAAEVPAAGAPAAGAPATEVPAARTAAEGTASKPAARKPAARKPAAKAPAADKPAARGTGNVRVLPEDEAKTTPVTARKPRPGKPTAAGTTPPAPPAAAQTGEVVAAPEGPVSTDAAPLPNYDTLTIASLRARLRSLSIEQVRALIGYEQAHANRAEVIAMFERRVVKLEAPES